MNHGAILNRRIFVQLEKSSIESDGLTISSEGYIRQAQWNSRKFSVMHLHQMWPRK
ncbi:hypothetical protein [Coxiella-like endosymbiont of Rhipicephalus sanguineus]|uniref:hypothetical protein n=1 Tax=Coxiella-like endosymbiont of Rhipicephalus sanguineus TaxID=1955402 RepID=UPI0027DF70D7|nr:hypothetical protein [Coxiella-like endosymbiont of Rhipicephalus sanguineus]